MAADEWIALEASLLNLFFVAMANFHQILFLEELCDLLFRQRGIALCKDAKVLQLIIIDIRPILLCEQIFVNPVSTAFCENDAPMPVFVQAFLEDPSAQIVGLALHHFLNGLTKLIISDASFSRGFGEPGGFESPHCFFAVGHGLYIALGAIDIKRRSDMPPVSTS
jgi:hypothetical protein